MCYVWVCLCAVYIGGSSYVDRLRDPHAYQDANVSIICVDCVPLHAEDITPETPAPVCQDSDCTWPRKG